MWIPVLPNNLLCAPRHLDDSGIGGAFSVTKSAVVEDQDVTIIELAGVVLLRDNSRVEMPDYFASVSGDDDDRGDTAERSEDIAVLERADGVDERPVVSSVMRL